MGRQQQWHIVLAVLEHYCIIRVTMVIHDKVASGAVTPKQPR